MAKVNILINGRKYALGCDDGEEERLTRLGQKLDDRLTALANNFGQIGDLKLMVMAGITMMDELDDLQGDITQHSERMTMNIRKEADSAKAQAARTERKATNALIDTAERIEAMAARLGKLDV